MTIVLKNKEKHVRLSADIIDSISHGALILYLTIDIIVLKNKEKHVRLSANIIDSIPHGALILYLRKRDVKSNICTKMKTTSQP